MALLIKISKLSNFLFFIQKIDKLNSVKHSVKPDFEKILSNEKLRLSFYKKREIETWNEAKKIIGRKKAEEIKKSFTLLKPAFLLYWSKAFQHLSLWKKYFQKNQSLLIKVLNEIKKLTGVRHFSVSQIPVYLVLKTKDNRQIKGWFSWNAKESFIVLEIPFNLKRPKDFFPLTVLGHEFFHLMLRKNKNLFSKIIDTARKNNKVIAKISKGIKAKIFLEELLISSFIPEGYLSEKFFKKKISLCISKPKDLLDWRKFVAFKLSQKAKTYTDKAKVIDKDYLKDLMNVIKQN